ncbi:MAG TPA: hypothetical protein VGZ93_02260 [Candidatus Methylacidiphilales bacterium]|jgi:hypothetical protein|nr:hypothetical protein [Candidatus Methylacidiphilales bacterium]
MNRSLLAFLLAGLTAGVLFTCFNCLSAAAVGSDGVVVTTTKDANIDQAVKAIDALDLKGVHVMKGSRFIWSFGNIVWTVAGFTLGFLIITGFMLFFYKLYCRWLGADPHL